MNRPNILLINCDDLGYGDLGCYANRHHRTPAIDRLASEGMRFTDFYMASPVCSASRAAMLTGSYPRRIGFPGVLRPGDARGLHPDEITFATLLQRQGYATRLVGKWHCGDQPAFLPTRHGFDSWFGLPYSNDMGRNRGDKPDKPPLPLMDNEQVLQEQPDQEGLTERYVQECVRFLRENQNRPFLLYLAHVHVHVPIYVQEKFMKTSGNALYGAAVACIDWSTDVLMRELTALGLDQNTLVVFTSDNGGRWSAPESNLPLRGAKASTWEGGFRVPCIMRWPGQIPPGSICREVATAMDLYPTFAHLGGAQVPVDRIIDGRDITPLCTGPQGATSPHEAFYFFDPGTGALDAVRSGNWKLFTERKGTGVRELYDLQNDVGEQHNVYERHPDIVRALTAHMALARQSLGDAATGTPGTHTRPCGKVDNPVPLTHYDPDHPYMIDEYDGKDERV